MKAISLLASLLVVTLLSGCNQERASAELAPLEVGALLPLTGPGAVFADYIKKGLDMAADEINQEDPGSIVLIYEDSENNPQRGISAFQQMVLTEDPPVVISALSSVTSAVAPLAGPNNTVVIGTAVALPGVTAPSDYVFRVYPEADGIAGVIAEYASDKYQTAGIAYIDDDFGQSSAEVFEELFEADGDSVLLTEPYELTERDFRAQWEKFKDANPDVVWIVGYGPAYSALVTQMREANVQSDLLADMTLGLPVTINNVGDAAEDVVYVDASIDPAFASRYESRYGERPTSYAGYAYDILMMLNEVRKGGNNTAESIRDSFADIEGYRGVMGNISMEEDRDAALDFILMEIESGMPEVYDGDNAENEEAVLVGEG
ncbi:MAG: ABC transporter substrate-binding protein [Bacteroidota bacterium]